MLKKLSISNYILIRELEIDFSRGLTVITGETGSGKSILLGALNLILGQRADAASLLDKSGKCIVEGCFSIKGYGLESFFTANDLDYDDNTLIRREINQNGKSRAFINDTPVNLNLIKELGDKLVNIHSQNSVITLNDSDFQTAILDSFSGQIEAVKSYMLEYRRYISKTKELEEYRLAEARSKGELDYYRFLLEELTKAGLKDGEQEDAEKRIEILSHAEEIKGSLFAAAENIGRAEINVLTLLSEVISSVTQASRFHPGAKELAERLRNNQIDLKDLQKEIEKLEEDTQFDPMELQETTQRLDLIYRLQKKHQVQSVGELLSIIHDIENKVNEDNNLELKISSLEREAGQLFSGLKAKASSMSEARNKARDAFRKEMEIRLGQLGMPASRFLVDIETREELGPVGADTVRFLFSANKGIDVSEISRSASGGELSRLMLSVKSMISKKNLLPTLILDEIDSGVSGDIAGKVGAILKRMSAEMQVIVITHLPQIAGKGDFHFSVFKSEKAGQAVTGIRKLKTGERVEEIARMMSNENVTPAAMKAAKELLTD